MPSQCQNYLDKYLEWLKNKSRVDNIDGICEITVPFLDRQNDRIQIYIEKVDENKYLLFDDGYTLSDLEACGIDVSTPKRQEIINSMLLVADACIDNGNIVIESNTNDLPRRMNDLIRAMQNIDDVYLMSLPYEEYRFKNEVKEYLREHEIWFTNSPKFLGHSGLYHSFDFSLNKNTIMAKLLKAVSTPDKASIKPILFSWLDIRDSISNNYKAMAFLNDTEDEVSNDVVTAFKSCNINTLLWSDREESAVIETFI